MYKQLTREQRYAIYLGLQRGATLQAIAREINVSVYSVGHEIKRNATARGRYMWDKTDAKACSRKGRSPGNRDKSETIRWIVKQLILDKQWSPGQISGWLAWNKDIHISHETIYAMIRSDATGEPAANCRHRMKYKRSRTRFGDQEMDLIVDRGSNAILTLVERKTNFLPMEKLGAWQKGHAIRQSRLEIAPALHG